MAYVDLNSKESEASDLEGFDVMNISQGHNSSKTERKTSSSGNCDEVTCIKGNDMKANDHHRNHSKVSSNPFGFITTLIR